MMQQDRFISIAVDMGASKFRIMASILEKDLTNIIELYRFENFTYIRFVWTFVYK